MHITETFLKGCYLLEPTVFEDERGFFFESFKKNELKAATGLDVDFLQHNQSISKQGVLRGLHLQTGAFAQSKLIKVVCGEVLDIVVDFRENSPHLDSI